MSDSAKVTCNGNLVKLIIPASTSYATISGATNAIYTTNGVCSSLPATSDLWSASGSYSGFRNAVEYPPIIGFYPAGVEQPYTGYLINISMESSLSDDGKQIWFTATGPSTAGLFSINRNNSEIMGNASASFLNSYTANPEQQSMLGISTCDVNVTSDGHGTVSYTPTGATLGTVLTLNATPNPGYSSVTWSRTGMSTNNKISASSVTASAKFNPETYTITVQNDGHGTLATSKSTAHYGDTVTLTPTRANYYQFSGYNVTGGTINGNTLTVTANCTAKANFKTNNFTAVGTFVTANLLSGSWQGIASAFPALKITAYTGLNSANICSTANSSNFAVWGGTGTNANNLSGQRGYKWSAVTGCVSPSALPSAWRISGNFNVKVKRNINVAIAWMTASAQRALTWRGPGQTVQTAGNFIGTGANATASATKTFTGYVSGNPSNLANCTVNVSMGNNNFSPPSSYSAKVKSYAYHMITALTGNWSATGYAK